MLDCYTITIIGDINPKYVVDLKLEGGRDIERCLGRDALTRDPNSFSSIKVIHRTSLCVYPIPGRDKSTARRTNKSCETSSGKSAASYLGPALYYELLGISELLIY